LPFNCEMTFFEAEYLKNVRTLEYDSFKKYLGDKRVKRNELIAVFSKKKNLESYSFFSIFTKEWIGMGQFALALLANLFCGILLFIPAYRKTFTPELPIDQLPQNLSIEIYLAIGIWVATVLYFVVGSLNAKYQFANPFNRNSKTR
jgi:hypothetical protein